MPAPIRVAIVSGDFMFRELLTLLFTGSGGLEVMAGDGDWQAVTREGPGDDSIDVVLIDAGYDLKLAMAQVRAAKDRWVKAAAVVVGLEQEDETVVDFIEAGACAYVLQSDSPEGLMTALREVHARRSPNSPWVVTAVLQRIASLAGAPVPLPRTIEPLTPREMEIVVLLARGLGNKEICQRLHVTVQTVKNHVHSILAKFQVHRRRQAVRLAYEMGLLIDPGPAEKV
jgi:DNA-binding NarL/FixJ family response regulator